MSRWFVRVGFLGCSVESPKLARDVSNLSPSNSRQVRDKLETARLEEVAVVESGLERSIRNGNATYGVRYNRPCAIVISQNTLD
jgi:hypothetical protein